MVFSPIKSDIPQLPKKTTTSYTHTAHTHQPNRTTLLCCSISHPNAFSTAPHCCRRRLQQHRWNRPSQREPRQGYLQKEAAGAKLQKSPKKPGLQLRSMISQGSDLTGPWMLAEEAVKTPVGISALLQSNFDLSAGKAPVILAKVARGSLLLSSLQASMEPCNDSSVHSTQRQTPKEKTANSPKC